ncbi:MAG: class I SAM-dependent DNA methyltransferase [Dehalococcoidia bacterium]
MTSNRPTLSPPEFVAKWLPNVGNERASAQEHFIDVCRLVGAATPNEADPNREFYTFERGAEKVGGGDGFADVWKRGFFGWEDKGKHKDLDAAYRQLLQYREALGNPPLLIVSDFNQIVIHTNFTNTEKRTYVVTLGGLLEDPAESLRILRAVFFDPEALRPERTPAQITEVAASRFARIARSLQDRGHDPERVAHFLNRILFCLFAEDANLLPSRIMSDLIASRGRDPASFAEGLSELFGKMRDGGHFGTQRIPWFNGGLFDTDEVIEFTLAEMVVVAEAANLDWSQVEPAVLGTLFERGLDPDKRGQLGAHYTDREKIMMVVEPVVMTPLRREFAALKVRVTELLAGRMPVPLTRDLQPRVNRPRWERDAEAAFFAFLDRLRGVRVLDPACGSGNFLYVTLKLLKDLEKEVSQWGSEVLRVTIPQPEVGPQCVLGIEINPYAAELARVSIWIGHIQWHNDNGFGYDQNPVLKRLDHIECRDAILTHDAAGRPQPAEWPPAEFIVGNPPFLGRAKLRGSLGDPYVRDLYEAWSGRVAREADLVCYWHEQARALIEAGRVQRAGLLATNRIREGSNRRVLDRIKETGDICFAWSDQPWILEGASVRVSIVGQDDGTSASRTLNGEPAVSINANLTAGGDLTTARPLVSNRGVAFQGPVKVGPFEIAGDVARRMLASPNPHGKRNADVIRPWLNGLDVTRRSRDYWIIEFDEATSEADASFYEAPFEYVREHVRPARLENRDQQRRENWWRLGRSGADLKRATAQLPRFIVTARVAKYRLFIWVDGRTLPDARLTAIARDDDYAFGVLHSRPHELWSLRTGGWHGVGNDPQYTPSSSFETFPFPWPLNTPDEALTSEQAGHRDAIGAAAKALDEARQRWLNPPELARLEADVIPSLPLRFVPVSEEAAKQLAKRTLTNLYNQRPAWLDHLHRDLDRAVFAAYGWPEDIEEEEMLRRLLALNLERAEAQA